MATRAVWWVLPPAVSLCAACAAPPPVQPSDRDVRAAVQVALALDPKTRPLDLAVIPDDGVVRLSGQTDTLAEQRYALGVAAAVPGVRDALDNMILHPQARTAIRASVEERLAAAPELAGVHFTVSVADGVVTLASDDTDPAQRALAVEIALAHEDVTEVRDRMR